MSLEDQMPVFIYCCQQMPSLGSQLSKINILLQLNISASQILLVLEKKKKS